MEDAINNKVLISKNYLTIGLLILIGVLMITVLSYSVLDTKSYNSSEKYNIDITRKAYVEGTRETFITENANINGAMIALGIIMGASIISIAILNQRNPE
ncbi:hypothetical protein GR160_09160 [Flavobacterium sp. Sd200]|uniref:hypothetical protein n=1 Tax=Flavobacterium sp. Sd200 TaxID=2692211 RepID=UPI0013709BE7|nr:hypothetical protein [Flavobacterium sp. Sd200]MXN91396.1 hypothetical protein [Flavobacterium sp. Sd200]